MVGSSSTQQWLQSSFTHSAGDPGTCRVTGRRSAPLPLQRSHFWIAVTGYQLELPPPESKPPPLLEEPPESYDEEDPQELDEPPESYDDDDEEDPQELDEPPLSDDEEAVDDGDVVSGGLYGVDSVAPMSTSPGWLW